MIREAAFWDSSALIPLLAVEPASPHARSLIRRFEFVVWWGTPVEVHSAIARRQRTSRTPGAHQHAIQRVHTLSRKWREISPSADLRELAQSLLYQHALRGADSLQLAAALIWCNEKPARRHFLGADQRLNQAAAAVGFSVVSL